MRAMIEFNVNNNVRVRLTDAGRAIVRAEREKTNDAIRNNGGTSEIPLAVKEDEHGWSTWQMWSFMQTFGAHVGLGMKMPFDTVIQIPVTDQTTAYYTHPANSDHAPKAP